MDRTKAEELARAAHSESTNYFDSSIRKEIEGDIRQFQSRHPVGSKYDSQQYAGRSRLFNPKTRSMVRRNEAVAAEAFFSTSDVVSVRAEDDADEVSKLAADVMGPIIQRRLTTTIPWFLIAIGAYQEAQVAGVVISYQSWATDKRRKLDGPQVKLVPVENFRFSPGAEWYDPIGTSPYLIEMVPMYVGKVRARMMMQGETHEEKPKGWIRYQDPELLAAALSNIDTTRLTRESGRTDPKDQRSQVDDFTLVWVHRNIVEMDGEDWLFYTLGRDKLLSKPVKLLDAYAHGRPYAMGISAIEAHRTYPGGPVRLSKDIQAETNEITNQRIDNVKFVMNKRYFVARNKQVDLRSLTHNVPSGVTLMQNPKEDVFVVDTPDVTSSSYAEHDRLNLAFDDLTGTFSGSSVQSNRSLNETVGGMNLLTSGANQVSGYQLRTFVETWVEVVLNQLIALEAAYETDENMIKLSPEGRAFISMNGQVDKLFSSAMRVKVNVGMGATNPTDQVNNFMTGLRALKEILSDGVLEQQGLDVQEIMKEIFGKLGYSNGSRFFHTDENADPRITMLQNQLAELQRALEAKHPPELVKAQVEKLLAEAKNITATGVDKRVSSVYSAVQAGQVLAAVPDVAPVADALLESAGFQPANGGAEVNLPQPAEPVDELNVQDVMNKRTGVGFSQGAHTNPETPMPLPQPAGPDAGMNAGIETPAADGVQQ